MNSLQSSILRTLLYYDIFEYPLSSREVFEFLPTNSVTYEEVQDELERLVQQGVLSVSQGLYAIGGKSGLLGPRRKEKELYARKLWRVARFVSQLIRRFPFVRGVFVSGDLSKNVADKDSDIDFFLITENRRLWICRAFLVLFKKIFLLNQRKFFCINHYITRDHLEVEEKNIYTACEIAHLKAAHCDGLYIQFLETNRWIKDFYPNLVFHENGWKKDEEAKSILRQLLELPFRGRWADRLDQALMNFMVKVWRRRYPELTPEERDKMFRCRPYESRAQGGNFEKRILEAYALRLKNFGIPRVPSDIQDGSLEEAPYEAS